jgi:hypothetical protein
MDQIKNEERERLTRRRESINPSSHGTQEKLKHRERKLMRTGRRQEKPSVSFRRISPLPNKKFDDQQQLHRAFPNLNGDISSREKPSTSMSSSITSITLPLLRRMWVTSDKQKFLLEKQIQLERYK